MSRLLLFIFVSSIVLSVAACGGGKKSINPPIPPGPENRIVNGVVIDSLGNPVPGLSVLLDGKPTSVKTSSTGAFKITESFFSKGANVDYRLALGIGGVVFAEQSIRPAINGDLQIQFSPGTGESGLLKGTVYDEVNTSTIDGALVIAFAYEAGLFFVESNDGAYSLELPGGNWLLFCWKDGFNPSVSVVEIQSGGETAQDIYLTPTGQPIPPAGIKVKGTVTDSLSGAPIANAFVTLMADTGYMGGGTPPPEPMPMPGVRDGDSGGGETEPGSAGAMPPDGVGSSMGIPDVVGMPYMPSYQETITDSAGNFEFPEGVVGYSVYFTVNAEGYLPGNEWSELPTTGDELVKDLDITPLIMTTVSGRCVDETGAPVPGAWVEFIFQGGSGGGWAMPLMEPDFMGGWVDGVESATRDYADSEGGAPMQAGAPGFAGSGGGNNDFDNPMFMKFLHEQRENRGTSQVEPGMPPDYFSGYYSVQADENGEFTIDQVAAGPYYVFADAYRHLPFSGNVEVSGDGTSEVEVLLENTPVGSVEGSVVDENGEPLVDVLINCVQPFRDPFTFTDASGRFRIDNIPEGIWIVGAYAIGYAAEGVEVFIGDGDVRRIDFQLRRYTPPQVDTVLFTGKVINGTSGDPVAGASLYVVSGDNKYWQTAVTDSQGIFTMNLVPTDYAIDIDAENQGFENLYTWFWVDTSYPQMDFYLWPFNMQGRGGWGGIVTPGGFPPPPDDGETVPPSGGGGGTAPGGGA